MTSDVCFCGQSGHAFLRREGSLFDPKRTLDGALANRV
jgi:hypothetical protein